MGQHKHENYYIITHQLKLLNTNPSASQLSLFGSFIITIFVFISVLLLTWLFNARINLFHLICISCCISVATFFVFFSLLEIFVYRKIKLIYKSIHQLKTKKGSIRTKIKNDDGILSTVALEVKDWASQYLRDIETLHKQEEYRRTFVSNVAHELKTPIFSIQSYLQTLLDIPITDENQNNYFINKALDNSNRLEIIVNKLLQISKYEAGDLLLESQPTNLELLCQKAIALVQQATLAKQINIVFKQGNSSNCVVLCEPVAMLEVLENIITNAIKYSPKGTDIVIGWYNMDTLVLVEIMDHGIGIEAKNLPFIFDRFYRVDHDRSRQKGGNGLGLSICKHIIEAHQQTIHARSAIGQGTTISFTLQSATALS